MRIETFFPYRLAIAAEAFSRQLFRVYGREFGLSREEWRLLFLLEDAGTLDSLQLAARTSLDKVQVSRAAARLDEKGLITRAIRDEDRRLRNFAITDAGRALFALCFGGVAARSEAILASMKPADRQALERGVAALHQAAADFAARSEAGEEAAAPK